MFFKFAGSRRVPAPFNSSSGDTKYYVVLATLVVVSLFVVMITQSRLGRVLRGMGDSQVAMSTLGL
jgi:ABC-type branched-subunit amino acid transport system permease subunit